MPSDAPAKLRPTDVLLLWPNVLCYIRAAMALGALSQAAVTEERCRPLLVVLLYVLPMALDGVDGALARSLGQETEFGAALDVLVDTATRGGMWVIAFGVFGLPVPLLEMLVFSCTHARGGAAWKTGCFAAAPRYVTAVMRNGFRSVPGALTVAGLHFLPLWLWLVPRLPESFHAAPATGAVTALLLAGRLLGAVVELWVVVRHFEKILSEDAAALSEKRKT
eukprot:TRINITY_DN20008_c0_g1_i1.p1 TRINITY_DN20008_c0_g1~~TRINITY_DN20008_c0_g1_i1.p1  ORF type:complete len:231 (+),score=30.75 TRINITY_DN20008_c0_g1_i1:30-695(+)